MNKVVAEAIAALIPRKMVRNRWRGILRYGPIKALRLKRRLRHDVSAHTHYLAVCAIAKDEGPYFKEWIEWHLSVGVEKFYIYDNESTDETRKVLQPYVDAGIVEYNYFPGYRMQLAAYDDCFERHRLDTRWIALIDLDEFIVPVKDKSITEFLRLHENAPAVEINWLVYGSSGKHEKTDEPVMERFTRHSLYDHHLNRFVKSIVNPRRVYGMIGCHEAARIDGRAEDTHGQPITRHFKERQPLHDVMRINHYAVRSRQEFIEKQNRGRASGRTHYVPDDYFDRFDLNDIQDGVGRGV